MFRVRKHVVDSGPISIAAATIQQFTLALGTINPIPYTNPTNVGVDSKVKSIKFMLDVMPNPTSTNASVQTLDWYINVAINGQTGFPNPGATGNAVINNEILHEEQALLSRPAVSSNAMYPRPLTWRLKLHIADSWSKFGQGDQIQFAIISSSADAYTIKYKCIFTEVLP